MDTLDNSNKEESSNFRLEDTLTKKTTLLSVYIDFKQETKRKYGWKLLPNQEFRRYSEDFDLDYYRILDFVEYDLKEKLAPLLQNTTGNKSIKVIHKDTREGSIELLLTIYGAYASFADFLETTRVIKEFINKHYDTIINNQFGAYFHVNTSEINPPAVPINNKVQNGVTILTLIVSLLSVIILYNFSFQFINNLITENKNIAVALAAIIEISKVIVSYNLIYLKIKNQQYNRKVLISIRIVAIALSSIFCITEITNINTAPNLSEYRENKKNEYKREFQKDSLDNVNSYEERLSQKKIENDKILIGVGMFSRNRAIDYSLASAEKRRLEKDIEALRREQDNKLQEKSNRLHETINLLMQADFLTPEMNNQKINSILTTVFNVNLSSEEYKLWYQSFVILSALLVASLIELISIGTVQNLSYYWLRR